jgi:hypothetical protein
MSVPETGAGPHGALHSCTVKLSLTAVIDHAPSYGPSARAVRAEVRRASTDRSAAARTNALDGKQR